MSKYRGVPFVDELADVASGVFKGRNIVDELGFTVDEVCTWGEEGTAIEHGLQIGDYFIMKIPNESGVYHAYTMQIAGIDNYYGTMYGSVPHHIDWISKELHDKNIPWNKTNFNNGMSDENDSYDMNPFLHSNIYMYLNAKSGVTADGQNVNYTTNGLLARINKSTDRNAIEWRSHLKEKYGYAESRWSDSGTLTEDNDWNEVTYEKLWLPTEVEVWGRPIWGDKTYGACFGTQYPIFRNNANIVKKKVGTNSWDYWWLASVHSGSSAYVCYVGSYGGAVYFNASYGYISFPICGRT